jgi:hypothetical protein
MTRDEYNKLFHKVGLNRVAFKAVNDCDDEILTLVNAAIAAERKKMEFDGIHTCSNECQRPACVAVREAVAAERETCAKVCEDIDAEYDHQDVLATWCADAIRARGQK